MLNIQKLPPERQRNTSEGLADLFKTGHSFDAEVAKHAQAAIRAAPSVSAPQGPLLPEVDRATDSIGSALFKNLMSWEQGLHGRLVPIDAKQQASLDAADLLHHRWFASGIGFLRQGAGVEFDGLRSIEQSLPEPEIKAAIELLGLSAFISVLEAHIALYRQALGLAAIDQAAGPDWHDTLQLYAASVMLTYAKEPETQRALMAPYAKQLAEHRTDVRAARKKAKNTT